MIRLPEYIQAFIPSEERRLLRDQEIAQRRWQELGGEDAFVVAVEELIEPTHSKFLFVWNNEERPPFGIGRTILYDIGKVSENFVVCRQVIGRLTGYNTIDIFFSTFHGVQNIEYYYLFSEDAQTKTYTDLSLKDVVKWGITHAAKRNIQLDLKSLTRAN